MMKLQLAREGDGALAMSFIDQARAHLKDRGIDQWQKGYPDLGCIQGDLAQSRGYFLVDGGEVLGYLCIDFGGEPAYEGLRGTWRSGGPYGVVHRMAFGDAARGRGLAAAAFALAEAECLRRGVEAMRVDTDADNGTMRHVLEKNGYAYRGTIRFDNSEKIAFDKLLGN